MVCVHCASSELFAAPASASLPLWTGDVTTLPVPASHVHGLRLPLSKPGFATRLLSARAREALMATAIAAATRIAAIMAANARRRVLAQVNAHLSRGKT